MGFELSLGATYAGAGNTRFRVWAPDRTRVDVVLEPSGSGALKPHALEARPGGYFEGTAPAKPGARYRFRLDGGEAFPDPCSRFQPEGPHGPSVVVDPNAFRWTDGGWDGPDRRGNVFYELHVGAFSRLGTYAGVAAELPRLKELGITAVELMPVNTFPGRFNWGYDGVSLFAPCAVYGSPDELRTLVDTCHRLGLAVLFDVVYNHLGPDGNYLRQYARSYFSERYAGEWGEPLNFDGTGSEGVRDFFIQNACYWLTEFHADGLRLDATHCIFDASKRHVLADLSDATRQAAAPRRPLLVAETETQDARLLEETDLGGYGMDLIWVDDFHHAASVAVTGLAEAYLSDYEGSARELLSCARHNALFQGQYFPWAKRARGSPLFGVDPDRIVFFLQNHDQIANSLRGERLHTLAGAPLARALAAYALLLPQTPLLFMGEEHFASSPFLYFVDHRGELAQKVREGREGALSLFDSIRTALTAEGARILHGEAAFEASRLRPEDRERGEPAWRLHQELLRLRREDPVFSGRARAGVDGAVLSERALLLRFFGRAGSGDRLVLLNLGPALERRACSEPLFAPPTAGAWRPILSSEDSRYGGGGAHYPAAQGPWHLAGPATMVLTSGP